MPRLERPSDGWARIVGPTGRQSQWVPVEDIEVTDRFVYIQGGLRGLRGAEFSWVAISHIEYVTNEEKLDLDKAAEKAKQKEGGAS